MKSFQASRLAPPGLSAPYGGQPQVIAPPYGGPQQVPSFPSSYVAPAPTLASNQGTPMPYARVQPRSVTPIQATQQPRTSSTAGSTAFPPHKLQPPTPTRMRIGGASAVAGSVEEAISSTKVSPAKLHSEADKTVLPWPSTLPAAKLDAAMPSALSEPLIQPSLQKPLIEPSAKKLDEDSRLAASLKAKKLDVDVELGHTEPVEPESKVAAWVRSAVLLCAGIVVWIWPERLFAVLLILAGLAASPCLGSLLLAPCALPRSPGAWARQLLARHLSPDSEIMVAVKEWLIEFAGSLGLAVLDKQELWKPKLAQAIAPDSKLMVEVNRFLVQFVGSLCDTVIKEKPKWMPPLIDTVGEVIPPALSTVMINRQGWSPALIELVGDVVPTVLQGVMGRHQAWSPALVQLVGDVVPPVLTTVLTKSHLWTPTLLQFIGDITPQVMMIVLRRPELPPAIAGFVSAAGPELAPAIVGLIDRIISDPQLMAAIKKITDNSMRDEEMLRGIKSVVEQSLKDSSMYRAVGHGMMSAAEHGVSNLKGKCKDALHLR